MVRKTERLANDVGTGEDVAFTDEEARANDTAIGAADPHE